MQVLSFIKITKEAGDNELRCIIISSLYVSDSNLCSFSLVNESQNLSKNRKNQLLVRLLMY